MSRSTLLIAFAIVSARFASAQLLNGGFEETTPGLYHPADHLIGWNVGGDSVDVVSNWDTAEGMKCLDLNGLAPGSVSQVLPVLPGRLYALGFAMAGNPDNGASPELRVMRVVWTSGASTLSDVLSFNMEGKSATNMGWVYHTYTVAAGAVTAALSFTSLSDTYYGPALDDVSLVLLPWGILGDMNCDGIDDFADIDPFVLALQSVAAYHAAYPNCDRDLADCNHDGYVDFGDIDPFVALLFRSCP